MTVDELWVADVIPAQEDVDRHWLSVVVGMMAP
jgi:hypothetical protein